MERQSEMMASLMRAMDVKEPAVVQSQSQPYQASRKRIDKDGEQFALGSDEEDPPDR